MTDFEWERLVHIDRKKAFEQLISEYGSLVYAIVINKLGSCAGRADIDDCAADIFVEVIESTDKYSSTFGTLKSYISTIAKRRAIDAYRVLVRRGSITDSIDDEDTVLPPSNDDTEAEAEKDILNQKLREAVGSLGEPDKAIIIYQYFYDMTVGEIAKKLSMTSAAVQKRSIRARAKIKAILEKG